MGRLFFALVALAGCSRPTEIRIDVTTDIACNTVGATGTSITVARGATEATTTITPTCNAGQIGSFLVLPSVGPNEDVTVTVATGAPSPAQCIQSERPRGCIVARRNTRFVANATIHLPITLSTACRDVVCKDGETCADGACRSGRIDDPSACERDGVCALHADAGAPDAAIVAPPPSRLCDPATTAASQVAKYQKGIGFILADATHLFWTSVEGSGGRVMLQRLSGGSALELVADRLLPVAIATDSTSLYFTANLPMTSTLSKVALDGSGQPRELAETTGAGGVVVDAKRIYWADSDEGTLMSLSLTGEGRATLVTDTPMARLVADDTHLYWIAGQTIGRVAKIGGTAQVLATPPGLADIAVDGTHVYWVANGMGGTGIVARAPKDGTGAVEILVTNQRQPSRLAVDDIAIYWTALDSTDNAFGALRKVGKTGGAPIPMQEHISPPIAVTVDATCVYWGNTNGDIMATRKNP